MKKVGRIITILLVLSVAAVLLYPTVKWYCFVSQDVKNLSKGSTEQIREYARGQAARDVRAMMEMAKSGSNVSIPEEFEYLKDLPRSQKAKTLGEALGSYSGESALLSAVEGHYRELIMDTKKLSGNVLQLGLDLKGGVSALLEAIPESLSEKLGREATVEEIQNAVLEDIAILNNRVDEFGVSEPDIRLQGTDQILIEIPGEADTERVSSFLQGKGSLFFMLVDSALTNQVNTYYRANPSSAYNLDGSLIKPSFVPDDYLFAGYYSKDSYGLDQLESFVVLNPQVQLDGNYIESSTTSKDSVTQRPVVNFKLSNEGGRKFYDITSANRGKSLAVVLDGKVKSVATINDAISENVQISGFTEKEAQDLAIVLKTASFAIDLEIVSQQAVGATLGSDAVRIGILAIAFGFVLVVLFMFLYYGFSGLVADFALLLNLFIMVSVLSALHFTVTLTSIAGLILTLGMAVDANVIIYERIKEELKAGRSPYQAVSIGFGRAFWTIMDSNITTIIAAIVLSGLGSSSVKGFAVTLAVGIATSLFTSLYVSHLIFDLFIGEDAKKISIMPLFSRRSK